VDAHNHVFQFFGGVTRIIVPDNLKTGVEKASWYTPVITRTYHELAEHYSTAVIPARVRKPRDKPNAEGTVGIISTWILASLRNQQFFSLHELNQAMFAKLREFNAKPFQKKPGSRLSAYLETEKDCLLPLPNSPYETAAWKTATVQFNYHVAVQGMYYSVPFLYIKQKVDVRVTQSVIEVFFQGSRVCSHLRLHGREGQYATDAAHMPDDHKKYTQWNAKRFISWAESIGENTAAVVKAILASHKVEQQGYRACMALLKAAEKYESGRIEDACRTVLVYTPTPSYKSVQTILRAGNVADAPKPFVPGNAVHGFTRGTEYYRAKAASDPRNGGER
jgi:hypothetical protein